MAGSPKIPLALNSHHEALWSSLVSRSIAAWDRLSTEQSFIRTDLPTHILQSCQSLDDLLAQRSGLPVMLWFFQIRDTFLSQARMNKWSRNNLDDYVLLPALPGFVMRRDCFFVSHYWCTPADPDPDGEILRLHQAQLEPQSWSYIWVDWTCIPQEPRSQPEEAYFERCLHTMSGIIRNCGFMYFYPPFEPKLWILYEITEYVLTCVGGLPSTSDIEPFLQHVGEMQQQGVQATLAKHKYYCRFDRDKRYLTSWLELLILVRRLFDVDNLRKIMDHMTWFHVSGTQFYPGAELNRYKGTLVVNGITHTFTPFPDWDEGKFWLESKDSPGQGMETS